MNTRNYLSNFFHQNLFPMTKFRLPLQNIPDHAKKISFPFITKCHCLNKSHFIKNDILLYTNKIKK